MAVTGPDFVALQVRDLERPHVSTPSGWGCGARPASPPGAVVFATEPIPFAVREPMVDLDAASRLGWGVALWLKADDGIDDLHDDLAEHGVAIVTAPFDGPFGRTFAFADPDGYVVTVHG